MTEKKHKEHKHSVHRAHPHEVHRPTAWFIIATIALIGILAGVAILYAIQNPIDTNKPYPKTPRVGQSLETNLYSVSVTDVKLLAGQDQAFPVPADKQVLAVTFVVKNKAALPLDFSPVQMTFLRDEAADQFNMSPSMLLTQPIEGGTIAAGASRGGQLSFLIPKDLNTAQKLKFYFDPRWGDMQPVSFDLGL